MENRSSTIKENKDLLEAIQIQTPFNYKLWMIKRKRNIKKIKIIKNMMVNKMMMKSTLTKINKTMMMMVI